MCTCVCVRVCAYCRCEPCSVLQRQLIRNSRWALLTIPGEYAKRDRQKKEMEMKIMRTENKGIAEKNPAGMHTGLRQMKMRQAQLSFSLSWLLKANSAAAFDLRPYMASFHRTTWAHTHTNTRMQTQMQVSLHSVCAGKKAFKQHMHRTTLLRKWPSFRPDI